MDVKQIRKAGRLLPRGLAMRLLKDRRPLLEQLLLPSCTPIGVTQTAEFSSSI